MHEAPSSVRKEPPDTGRLGPHLFWLWMGGMGFGGNLAMLITTPRSGAPVYIAFILVAVSVTFFSALGSLRLFTEALAYRAESAPEIEIPEIG